MKTEAQLSTKEWEVRRHAESDLEKFIALVAPYRVLGGVHRDLIQWWEREDAKDHQLALMPRDHGKSAMIAFRVAWYLAKDPTLRVLYISSTSNLAEKQLGFMKNILECSTFQRYWPDHIHPDEGKRAKWTNSEIVLDHPKRYEEGIRDPSIFTGGLTTSLTGLHCDIAVLDDVVVHENAYTEEGRNKVKTQYSLLSSIEGSEAQEWVVGTRYHPRDLYNELISTEEEVYNEDGDIIGTNEVYEIFERQVEDLGDGTGQFLWPRQQRSDGKWFGFNREILAKKRAKYLDRTQFRAQYYNDPNDPSGNGISRDHFQYYDKQYLKQSAGRWYFKNKRLNVYASIDFAFTTSNRSDYSALVVLGIDGDGQIYVLDIERFKTDRVSEYFQRILDMHIRWEFRKLRAEVVSAQSVIVKELKNNYITPNGLSLSIDEHRPTKHQGTKEERIAAILQPRYENQSIWHYKSGNCQILEDELVLKKPPHDDVKDALASGIEIAVPPRGHRKRSRNQDNVIFNSRFGGVSY